MKYALGFLGPRLSASSSEKRFASSILDPAMSPYIPKVDLLFRPLDLSYLRIEGFTYLSNREL